MATRIKVMGQCPYCNRHVAKDLRPINMLSTRDAKRISQLINEVQRPVQLESEEEMQDREEEVHGNRSRKAQVSQRKGMKESGRKSISKKIINSSCSQRKSKIGTRSGKPRVSKRKTEILGMSESGVESKDPSSLGKINKEARSRTTRGSNSKNRIQDVSDSEDKMENDFFSQGDLNNDKSSQEKLKEGSCTPKELIESRSSLEELVEKSCFQEELNKSDNSQGELEENDSQKDKSENSVGAITGCILGLVEQEFGRDPACSGSSGILKGNAEVIVAMLAEEEHMIKKIRKRSSQSSWWEADEPPAKKRRC